MHPSIVLKKSTKCREMHIIPYPTREYLALFNNISRDTTLFLQEAGIEKDSEQHKALKKTIQSLHRQHMHPFKHVHEQESETNNVIAKARSRLPWLAQYEDSWPARIYLQRYVAGRRPHLQCPRHSLWKKRLTRKQHAQPTKTLSPLKRPDPTLWDFLRSLNPSLEHHLDVFVRLGIRDQKTLQAFLSWPQINQMQFLDENHGQLQLTTLEKKGLLVGCGLLAQRALERSIDEMVKQGSFQF